MRRGASRATSNISQSEPTEDIRWQKNFYEALLGAQSNAGEGLLVVENGRIRYANEAFCLISGYNVAELAALPRFLELVVPDQRHLVENHMHGLLHGEAVESRCQATILHRSGRRADVEIAARPLGKKVRLPQLVTIVRDVTEHKLLEEKLKSSLEVLVAVHDAGRALNSTLEQNEIGARLLNIVVRVSGLDAAVIDLQGKDERLEMSANVGPENLWKTASATPETQVAHLRALECKEYQLFRLKGLEGDKTPSVGLCLPLVIQDRVIGVLKAYGPECLAEKATLEALESLATQAASALENARLYRKVAEQERRLRDLVDKLLVAREEERRRIAYDLHDGLTQLAVAAHQNLQAYTDTCPPSHPFCEGKLDRALDLVKRTLEEARRVVAGLRQPALDDLELTAALRSQVDSLRSEGWEVAYDEDLWEERLPAEIEAALYGVAQEALTNVRKHAGITRVHVTLTQVGKRICLRIRDWGRGFDGAMLQQDVDVPGERVGFRRMQQRIALLGGEFAVHSQPGAGTCVVAETPLPQTTLTQRKRMPNPQSMASLSRLVIADDYDLVRDGLRTMLASEPDLEIVGEAADGREALELCRRLHPDVILMGARMPKMDGLAAARAIKAENPAAVILILTAYENPDYLLEAIRAGATGYVIKDATKHDLVRAVRSALSSDHPLDQELAVQLLQSLAVEHEQETRTLRQPAKQAEPLPEPLTPRELEVLQLLAQGQTNRQISRKLVISAATVKVHVEHILAKLKVCDRTQAAVRASEAGLLTLGE